MPRYLGVMLVIALSIANSKTGVLNKSYSKDFYIFFLLFALFAAGDVTNFAQLHEKKFCGIKCHRNKHLFINVQFIQFTV